MKLITKAIRAQLLRPNNPKPHLKLFTPWGAATWLISEIDERDPNLLFGLCDLGLGSPELGYVSLVELEALRGPAGLRVERDIHWKPTKTLQEYADEAYARGRLVA